MDIQILVDICLDAFKILYDAFNYIVEVLPFTVNDALIVLRNEFPFVADLVNSLVGLVGLGDLTILEVVFGGVALVLVGSFSKWLRDFIR